MSKYCVKAFDTDGVLILQIVEDDLLHAIDVMNQKYPDSTVKCTLLDDERNE